MTERRLVEIRTAAEVLEREGMGVARDLNDLLAERDALARENERYREALAEAHRYVAEFIRHWDKNDDGTFPMGHNFTVSLGNLRAMSEGRAAQYKENAGGPNPTAKD